MQETIKRKRILRKGAFSINKYQLIQKVLLKFCFWSYLLSNLHQYFSVRTKATFKIQTIRPVKAIDEYKGKMCFPLLSYPSQQTTHKKNFAVMINRELLNTICWRYTSWIYFNLEWPPNFGTYLYIVLVSNLFAKIKAISIRLSWHLLKALA